MVLRYVTYLYQEHDNVVLASNALYMEHMNWEKRAMYQLYCLQLSAAFEYLPNTVAAAL